MFIPFHLVATLLHLHSMIVLEMALVCMARCTADV